MMIQKSFGITIEYTFGVDELTYILKKGKNINEFKIKYEKIDGKVYEYEQNNKILFYISLLIISVGLLYNLILLILDGTISFPLIFIIGLTILLFTLPKSITYKYIKGGDTKILIIKNRYTKAIINEILLARNNYLKRKYYFVNNSNQKQHELYKFKWLLDKQVINQEEYEHMINELENVEKII